MINEAKKDLDWARLYEGEDDGLTLPIERVFSFPFRSLRYWKVTKVMSRYSEKILKKANDLVQKYREELSKSMAEISQRAKDLKEELEKAQSSGDKIEIEAKKNQLDQFGRDVESHMKDRLGNLKNSIDKLMDTYTSAIHDRIEKKGYIISIELSPKGKADLKLIWEQYISKIKQMIYQKTIKLINEQDAKELDYLVNELKAIVDDENRKSRSRDNDFRKKGSILYDSSGKLKKATLTGDLKDLVDFLTNELQKKSSKALAPGQSPLDEGVKFNITDYILKSKRQDDYSITFSVDHDDPDPKNWKLIASFFPIGRVYSSDLIDEVPLKERREISDIIKYIDFSVGAITPKSPTGTTPSMEMSRRGLSAIETVLKELFGNLKYANKFSSDIRDFYTRNREEFSDILIDYVVSDLKDSKLINTFNQGAESTIRNQVSMLLRNSAFIQKIKKEFKSAKRPTQKEVKSLEKTLHGVDSPSGVEREKELNKAISYIEAILDDTYYREKQKIILLILLSKTIKELSDEDVWKGGLGQMVLNLLKPELYKKIMKGIPVDPTKIIVKEGGKVISDHFISYLEYKKWYL